MKKIEVIKLSTWGAIGGVALTMALLVAFCVNVPYTVWAILCGLMIVFYLPTGYDKIRKEKEKSGGDKNNSLTCRNGHLLHVLHGQPNASPDAPPYILACNILGCRSAIIPQSIKCVGGSRL